MPSGKHRPAIVVHVWGTNAVNLQVFTDGANDDAVSLLQWEHGVLYDEAMNVRTWHWPEREDPKPAPQTVAAPGIESGEAVGKL
jgi:hypothetical protein